MLKKIFSAAAVSACALAMTGCASTGVVPMDKGTYLVSKKSPQVGFGPPVAVKAEVYAEANTFCEKEGKAVETLRLEVTNPGLARSGAVELQFRCVPR